MQFFKKRFGKPDLVSEYLFQCKKMYFDKLHPPPPVDFLDTDLNDQYGHLKSLAQNIIRKLGRKRFASFMAEGQYFVQLWTAHFLLEESQLESELREECLNEIERYASNSRAPEIAHKERVWLAAHFPERLNKA